MVLWLERWVDAKKTPNELKDPNNFHHCRNIELPSVMCMFKLVERWEEKSPHWSSLYALFSLAWVLLCLSGCKKLNPLWQWLTWLSQNTWKRSSFHLLTWYLLGVLCEMFYEHFNTALFSRFWLHIVLSACRDRCDLAYCELTSFFIKQQVKLTRWFSLAWFLL